MTSPRHTELAGHLAAIRARVAAACAARGIPFGAALGVANYVGARAREEWRAHHRTAAAAAVDAVLRCIDDLSSSLSRSPR